MMEAFLMYLLKSSGVLLLFLGSYFLFLRKETFFESNRWFLLMGLITSLAWPMITFTETILVEAILPIATTVDEDIAAEIPVAVENSEFNWAYLVLFTYIVGFLFFGFRLVRQLLKINYFKNTGAVSRIDHYYHVITRKIVSPFSFFRYIFYNPDQYETEELHAILEHEEVHAKQYHTVDVLAVELLCVLFWFNPFIWYYARTLKQNLEYLADKGAQKHLEKKFYQYLMLKQAVGHQSLTLTSPFYNSLIKKRIIMLNKKPSNRKNVLKTLVILPLLGAFLMAFNTKKVVKVVAPTPINSSVTIADTPKFISPLPQPVKITSPFGNMVNNKVHKGIDLKAPMGTDIFASAHGKVLESSYDDTNGNYIVLEHPEGYSTKYKHLKTSLVKKGAIVEMGQIIGKVGNTGVSTGPHLHFEMTKEGTAIDPTNLLDFGITADTTPKSAAQSKTLKVQRPQKSIKVTIDKNTSDAELEKLKNDFAQDDIDFSYTVVHNGNSEIISISIQVSGQKNDGSKFNSHFNTESDGPIQPITITVDEDQNVSIYNGKVYFAGDFDFTVISNANDDTIETIEVHEDDEHDDGVHMITIYEGKQEGDGKKIVAKKLKTGSEDMAWVQRNDKDHQTIEIKNINVKKAIKVNGKVVSKEEYEKLKETDENLERHITIKKSGTDSNSSVMIIKDSDDDEDVEFVEDDAFFYIDTDGKEEPLYIIDGKKASREEFKNLSKEDILTIDVKKGDGAHKKYGKKAKNGVVEITTKNHK